MDALQDIPQTVLLAGGVLVTFLLLALMSALRRTPKDAPPVVSQGLPLVGNIAAFIRSPIKMMQACYKE